MGAAQSSTGPSGSGEAPHKTCHYELLGINSLAVEADIRRAYKKKALEFHPDRNINNVETATRLFAEVQTAYEVLMDPQERAWYDSHRDKLQNPSFSTTGPPSTSPNAPITTDYLSYLMLSFDDTTPMADTPDGFYGILLTTFTRLAAAETAASLSQNLDPLDFPPFGTTVSPYASVVAPFYRTWTSFHSRQTFAWADKYKLSTATDRQERRAMEKENKKARYEASHDFNDTVRSLALFARRRDARYTAGKKAQAAATARKEAEQKKKAKAATEAKNQAARDRAANREKSIQKSSQGSVVPDWATSQPPEEHDAVYPSSEEEEVREVIECVACEKIFKTEAAFTSHEGSKKHIKAVQKIQRQMAWEDKHFHLSEAAKKGETAGSEHTAPLSEDHGGASGNSGYEDEEDTPDMVPLSPPAADAYISQDAALDQEQEKEPKQTGDNNLPQSTITSSEDSDGDYGPRIGLEDRLSTSPKPPPTDPMPSLSETLSFTLIQEPPGKKIGKAKAKRQKKAAAAAAAEEKKPTGENKCGICAEEFPSRTKLFKHVKDQGHAQLVSVQNPGTGTGKKRSKK